MSGGFTNNFEDVDTCSLCGNPIPNRGAAREKAFYVDWAIFKKINMIRDDEPTSLCDKCIKKYKRESFIEMIIPMGI